MVKPPFYQISVAFSIECLPSTPTVDTATTSTLKLTFGTETNPSSTLYTIYESSTGYYVTTGNVLSTTTPAWTTTSSWNNPVITGLSPNTQYTFQLLAKNATGVYSATTTASAVYTMANSAGTPTIGTPTATTLPITIDVNSNPAATTYAVYNSTDGNYLDSVGASTSTAVYSTTSTLGSSFAATGLTANTAYQFTVIVRNGDSVNAATSTASTATYTGSNIPSSVSATADSTTQITLTWSGDATDYYAENTTASTNSGWDSATTFVSTGLTCGTSYSFRVKGKNVDDVETAYASSVSATTSDCPSTSSGAAAPISNPPTIVSGQSAVSQVDGSTIGFNIENAIDIAISTDPNFTNISFEDYTDTLDISDYEEGETIYIKLRSDDGGTQVVEYIVGDETSKEKITEKETTCPLIQKQSYKITESTSVYYITSDCTKRAFKRSDVFFTYFDSWDDVKTTTKTKLDSISDDTLGFMPYGPKYDPKYGALVKTVTDSRVYLLLGTEKYWITSETVFNALNYSWDWIEDVDQGLLDKYTTASEINYTDHHPNYTLIKYQDDSKVYRLEPASAEAMAGKQVKRWVPDEAIFESLNFRWDRIVTVPDTEIYETGEDLVSD